MANISLMVLPRPDGDYVPQILMDRNGVWRDMSPPGEGSSVPLSKLKGKIDELLGKLMKEVAKGATFDAKHPGITQIGEDFYKSLVPAKVRELLAKEARTATGDEVPTLRIHLHPSTEWIPWEFFYDPDANNYLGISFDIARLPFVVHVLDVGEDQPRSIRRIYNLLGKNVLDDSAQQKLWEDTFDGLIKPPVEEIRFPAKDTPNEFPNTAQIVLGGAGDILHVTCHGIRTSGGEVYWTLDHLSPLTIFFNFNTDNVNKMVLQTRPLVFGNACASNASAPNQTDGGLIPPTFGSSFFGQGALNFIGTFAPITKQLALDFAPRFYKNLLSNGENPGPVIGKTLRQTKKHYLDQNWREPSYLFYCLYGSPDNSFKTS